MCASGGSRHGGTIFEYNTTTDELTKRHDFDGWFNGMTPLGRLTLTEDGKFYGLTLAGGDFGLGILFEFDPANGSFIKKIDFDGPTKGSFPYGSLLYASNKRLYGVTERGVQGYGGLFQYNPATGHFSIVTTFDGSSNGKGATSRTTPTQASNGIIYGMTSGGGTAQDGVLFAYDPVSQGYVVLLCFNSGDDGDRPMGALVQGMNGKLYGTTYNGGVNRSGTIYEFDLTHGTYNKKMDLSLENGAYPMGGLMRSTNGNLYGLARFGGINNSGVLFEYDPVLNQYKKKFDFPGDASNPIGVLAQHANGTLYGVTENGGINNNGVLFSWNPVTGIFTELLLFDGYGNGGKPTGTVLIEGDLLFGLAATGGSGNNGVFYSYDLKSGSPSVITYFDGKLRGATPLGSLLKAENGKFYGLTNRGGIYNRGILFEFDPAENKFVKRYDFHNELSLGVDIQGSLAQSSNGKLYGTIGQGGSSNYGVVYEFDLINNTFDKKHDFIGNNGARPWYGQLLYVNLQEQYITFDPLPQKTYLDEPFTLFATTSSGLPVTFESSNPAIASIDSNAVTIHKGGVVVITAKQNGGINFHPAEPVSQQLFIHSKELHLYPNPCRHELYLKLNRKFDVLDVVAVDILGRKIKVPFQCIDQYQLIYRCDISGLSHGLYRIMVPHHGLGTVVVR
jgi:uncharacterized repeat protein (TIGR03803 family)